MKTVLMVQDIDENCQPIAEESERLAAIFGHQFRTPLTSLKGALGLLLSGKLDLQTEQGQRLLKIAANSVERLERLTAVIEAEDRESMQINSPAKMQKFLLEMELRLAVEYQGLTVFYQPIACVKTGRLMGFEALVRWQHPVRGFIPPAEFIPLAEETQLIGELGLWVLEQACSQLRQWQIEFPFAEPLTMSVNLSPVQLLQPNLVEQIQKIYTQSGIVPGSLRLEITESALGGDSQSAIATLRQLKAIGIQLYLDDFGTGYSSFRRLPELPIDALKIDRFFVSHQQWDLIWNIQLLAMSLGLETITEGIETHEELENVKKLGGQKFQGYLFSQPLPSDRVTELIASQWQAIEIL